MITVLLVLIVALAGAELLHQYLGGELRRLSRDLEARRLTEADLHQHLQRIIRGE